MQHVKNTFTDIWGWISKSKKRMITLGALFAVIATIGIFAKADGGPGIGVNQWPGGRISYRLDLHYGQTAMKSSNPPADNQMPVYKDSAYQQRLTKTWIPRVGLVWCIPFFDSSGFTGAITFPIGSSPSGTADDPADQGMHYTTHYIKHEDFQYFISGTGHFNSLWNTDTWWNRLPSAPSYTSLCPGNGDYIYVSINAGFAVLGDGTSDGYYRLYETQNNSVVMQRHTPPNYYPYFDSAHSDTVNAGYTWDITYTSGWGGNALHEGTNTIYMAGMDLSGNYLTDSRTLRWDSYGPILSNTINSNTHNGWINKSIVDDGNTFFISGKDSTAYTTDISGVHASSLQFSYDGGGYGGYNYSTDPGGVTGTTTYTGAYASLVNQLGQGAHTVGFTMFDWAGNYGVSAEPVKIDTVAPTITARPNYGQFNSTKDGIAVDLTFSDGTSGVDASTEQYQWVEEGQAPKDNAWFRFYDGNTVKQTQKGVWELYYKASDKAGNAAASHTGPYYCGSLTGYIQNPQTSYLTDEDVIASVIIQSNDSGDMTPTNGASVTFLVKDAAGNVVSDQTKQLVVPNEQSQLLWFRFHTPAQAGNLTLTATINSSMADAQHNPFSLQWACNAPTENTPPDTNRDDKMPDGFHVQDPAPSGLSSSLSWNEWAYTGGAFQQRTYTATLSSALKITPTTGTDSNLRVVTATKDEAGHWTMKSGYGITETATSSVAVTSSTSSPVDASSATPAQLAEARYPEFNYWGSYFRLLQSAGGGTFTLQPNKYSLLDLPEHFTPVGFPDGPYKALATVSQAWTPAGMLGSDSTDTITISGALPQDWYVRIYP